MSILTQIYNIEYNDGRIARCYNILAFINNTRNFWGVCGDNLKVKKLKITNSNRYFNLKNAVPRPGTTLINFCDSSQYYYTDYLFVVKNGANNIIHPQVLWDAIIAEKGIPKIKYCDTQYIGRYGFTSRRDNKKDRGKRKGCYASRNRNYWQNYKQYFQSLDIKNEPPVRKRDVIYSISSTEMWYDSPHRDCSKSWKDQSKRTTQYKGA